MTSTRAAETRRRLDEITAALNALERRLDELEDLIEAAWDEVVAVTPRRAEATEGDEVPSESRQCDAS